MDRGTGDRAVSEVVGFILIFGMLVTAFTVYQGIVVPDQNRQVEFQHNQEVQGQMQDLRNAIVSTAATDSGQAVSITLGASYPTRALAMNLGVSAGSLQTTGGGDVVLQNVSTNEDETIDYVNGSVGPFQTTSIQYTPVYSFYAEAPRTHYENSVVYNRFNGANLTLTDQSLVHGRTLTIVTLGGNLSASQQGTVSVNTRPISVSSNRVPITSNGSGPITVTIPTDLSASQWREILDGEYDPTDTNPDAYVSAVTDAGQNSVQLVLEPNVDYGLRLARIGVGDGTSSPTPHYLTSISGNGSTVATDGQEQLVVEVRDRYNNPVTGVEVNVTGPSVVPSQIETGADGQATYTYEASSPGSKSITMNISGSPLPREEVTFSVNVESTGGGGGGGGGAFDLIWQNPSGPEISGCSSGPCTWDLDADADELLTVTAGTTPTLEGMEVNFAVGDSTVARIDSATDQTDSGGEATVTIQAVSNGTVGLFVGGGGSSDRIDVMVENVHPDVVYNSDVTATNSDNSIIEFSITNQFSDGVDITAITIDDAGSADFIESGAPEISIDATTNGQASTASSQGYDVGDQINLDTTAMMASGTTARITIDEFRTDLFGGFSYATDLAGEDVDVTITFEDTDGNQFTRSYTLSVP